MLVAEETIAPSFGAVLTANFIAVKQDVTERRVTQAALQSSKQRLEDAQHIASLGSC